MIGRLINKFLQPKDTISFKQGFDLTSLPVCTFTQGEKKLNFLLDSGSNDNIIDQRCLENIEYNMMKETNSLSGLDGIKHQVSICSIDIEYKLHHYPFYYLIKDMSGPFDDIKESTGVTIHGILGSKFFNEFKYVLDFDELVAYSKK